jgi:hypothetical protein
VKGLFALAALAGLSGCASFAPLDEAERARIRAVAPAAARFAPNVEFKVPPGKAEGAAAGGAEMALRSAEICVWFIWTGPGFAGCLAVFGGAGAAIGAAITPSSEGLEAMIERARSQLGAPDVQQLLMQRFSERVARLTSHTIDLSASKHGPQSHTDAPSYSGTAAREGTLVAEVAVEFVGATLVEPFVLFGTDYASRPLRIGLNARMRLVRPSDGATVMTRYYFVARYGRRIQEYQEDGARLLHAIAGAVDEVATLMVDDAFLFRSVAPSDGGAYSPAVTALEPLPSSLCLATAYDCWMFNRVPRLDTVSPKFRWKPFPEPGHLETVPRLRAARNIVYDLWVFGGDDDRVVEGLKTTEHTLERPLAHCMRYSWAVRARFDTDAGPRTVEWSTASTYHRSAFDKPLSNPAVRPTFGAPFITPCPARAVGLESGPSKR